MLNCLAIAIRKGLQYGGPLEEFVDTFTLTRFEPQGPCDHPNIKMVTSVVDYVFRVLGLDYLHRTDFVQVKPVDPAVEEKISATESAAEAQALGEMPAKRIEPQGIASPVSQPVGVASGVESPALAHAHAVAPSAKALDSQLSSMMGDAPFCDICGHITVRNGACYKCLNCGNSIGCS